VEEDQEGRAADNTTWTIVARAIYIPMHWQKEILGQNEQRA
jgi:hypothetical protein